VPGSLPFWRFLLASSSNSASPLFQVRGPFLYITSH
jgi:hypothetical protein